MISLEQRTWNEVNREIATNFKAIRKRKKISQTEMAKKAGVSFGSLKRFEQTGEISLQSLSKLAIALGVENELLSLFTKVPFESIEEIINGQDK